MKTTLLVALVLLIPLVGAGEEKRSLAPFEGAAEAPPRNVVDEAVTAALREKGIEPSPLCSDDVFVRRVFLDVIGTLPTPEEVMAFQRDGRADRRARLIDALLLRPEFADYWSMKWCDWLRVKAEFPINLWPNAVQAYHRWVHDAIRQNRPYDRVVREMLTASGSNFRVPAVNFFRAVQSREPAAFAQTVALTLMGSRIEAWPEDRRNGLAAFFSRLSYKRSVEWKEEIVTADPAPAEPVEAMFPDGVRVTVPATDDPRVVFADWLLKPGNPWFARSAVNRVCGWLLGRGVVHEPDDIRPDNPASVPALLTALEREFVLADHDLRHVYRLILNSATYQRSPIPRSDHPDAERMFAHAIVRRLDAEVLIDAICGITGSTEKYSSATPEPYTYVPEENRSIALSDGSITSPFLEMFGRPSRDTGLWSERNNDPTDGQRLHLLNSSDIQRRIERSLRISKVLRDAGRNSRRAIGALYLLILSRQPTAQEMAAAESYARKARLNPKQAADDLVWALINSKEFLYRH